MTPYQKTLITLALVGIAVALVVLVLAGSGAIAR